MFDRTPFQFKIQACSSILKGGVVHLYLSYGCRIKQTFFVFIVFTSNQKTGKWERLLLRHMFV